MRMSPQIKQYKTLLPDDLQKVIKEISCSYQRNWQIISSHLQALYGKHAEPQYCLHAYYNSADYKKNKQVIHRCPDLPLLQFQDIQIMLADEKAYNQKVQDLIELCTQPDGKDKINKMATLIGLQPNRTEDSLYRYFVAKDDISDCEWQVIAERFSQNQNVVDVAVTMLAKTFLPGYLLDFPAVGCVMTQPRSRYYYRGENAYYRSSKASYFRSSDKTMPASIQEFINRLRLYQCWETFDKLDAVKGWQFCEVNYLALAQHYGFKTKMIDITSDLKTALFFACCKFGVDRKWHPLTNRDFAHRNSRSHISALDGDSRYGVIFRSPSEITDLRWCVEPETTYSEIIIPVGYQPLMRCSAQYAYMLLTEKDYDLFKDRRFDKFKFRLTEDICEWIYEEMHHGDCIYPNDDIPDISKEVESMNSQHKFAKTVFDAVAEDFRLSSDNKALALQFLEQHGFEITDDCFCITPEKLAQINDAYSANQAMGRAKITPKMSPLFTV